MANSSSGLIKRSLLALIPLSYALIMIIHDANPNISMLYTGFPCLALTAFLVFPSATSVAGEHVSNFLFPQSCHNNGKAMLSGVDRLILEGSYEQALELLLRLGRKYPNDSAVWLRVFGITWNQIGDPDLAKNYRLLARETTTDPDALIRIEHVYLLCSDSYIDPNGDTGDIPTPVPGETRADVGFHHIESWQSGTYCAIIQPKAPP